MKHFDLNGASIAKAVLLAGPTFLILSALGTAFDSGAPIVTDAISRESFMVLFLLVPVIIVGAIVAIVPCMIGANFMGMLGHWNFALRLPPVWAIAGAAMPAGCMLALDDADGTLWTALIGTGAICALICRIGIRWHDVEPAPVQVCPRAVEPPDHGMLRRGFLR